ncbi:hypothetical protein HDU78_005446 [Chytriomyces hyalinus]|nr:hypothetical protein HDU78_005446 [Chytriomyces hyalinus]
MATATERIEQTPNNNHIPLHVRIKEVVVNYLPLGYITFGGPQAHIALLLDLFVVKRQWLSEEMFAELFAMSNALPGPASTQLAFTVALIRGGVIPGILAFVIWSLPGGVVMGALGYGVGRLGTSSIPNWLLYIERSLAAVGIALVALAAKKLISKLLIDKTNCTLAMIAVVLVINFSSVAWVIPAIMFFGGVVTYLESILPDLVAKWKQQKMKRGVETAAAAAPSTDTLVGNGVDAEAQASSANDLIQPVSVPAAAAATPATPATTADPVPAETEKPVDLRIYFSYSMTAGFVLIGFYVGLLILSAILRSLNLNQPLNILSMFYFVGAIIFGGGPVVVPLLYSYVVSSTGWLSDTEFLMGFAIINVMPGPNFNFAAFCGALAFRDTAGTSIVGALLAWIGIFLPGLLVKAGILPIWRHYRSLPLLRVVFKGMNSVAVGLLVAAVFLLGQKAVVLAQSRGAASLVDYPGWTAVMVVAFWAMDVVGIEGVWVVFGGAIVGVIVWAADGRP